MCHYEHGNSHGVLSKYRIGAVIAYAISVLLDLVTIPTVCYGLISAVKAQTDRISSRSVLVFDIEESSFDDFPLGSNVSAEF